MVFVFLTANGKTVDELDFPPEHANHLKITEGSDEDVFIENLEFQKGMLQDAYDLMTVNLNDPIAWERLPTNEGVEKPQSLVFAIPATSKRVMDSFIGRIPEFSLKYPIMIGNLFLDLECEGMAALLGQFIADRLTGLSIEDMSKTTGIAIPPNAYKRLKKPIPSFNEVLDAVKVLFPLSEIGKQPRRPEEDD